MKYPPDMTLWNIVKRRVTPLGQPRPVRDGACAGTFTLPVVQPTSVDLHGHTIQQAYDLVRRTIDAAYREGHHSITIITGKSGEIRREFPVWAGLHPKVRSISEQNGGGAFIVRLVRNPFNKTI